MDHVLRMIACYPDCNYEIEKRVLDDIQALNMGSVVHVMVFEFLTLPTLTFRTFVSSRSAMLKPRELGQLRDFLRKLIEKYAELHARHIYHLDIKPENVVADKNDFRIIDFGTAIDAEATNKKFVFCRNAYIQLEGQSTGYVFETTRLYSSF